MASITQIITDKYGLKLVDQGNGEYVSAQQYIREWSVNGVRKRLILNKGNETNIASVPGLFGLSKLLGFSPDGPWRPSSYIHDILYDSIKNNKGKLDPDAGFYQIFIPDDSHPNGGEWENANSRWKRKHADEMFLYFMIQDNVPKWKAKVMYQTVRAFGGLHMRLS